MNQPLTDFTTCDQEPIHIPGKIQSHGYLIAVSSKSFMVTHLSDNFSNLLKENLTHYLGDHLDVLMADISDLVIESGLTFSQLIIAGKTNESRTGSVVQLIINNNRYNYIINKAGDKYLVELDPVFTNATVELQKTIGSSISVILAEQNLLAMLQKAAAEVKRMIGYDRVMIYRFDEDGHGEVIAEEKNDNLEAFLGLHYPATDIPKQARELYKLNLTRIIADVNADCPGIITSNKVNAPLDLTHSVLRAVSPVHIQYLKNMEVCSSFSISLISNGELWGLIACHNYSPRFINYRARENAKLIGQIMSPALEFRLGEEHNTRNAELAETVHKLIRYIETDSELADALTKHAVNISHIAFCTGAVLIYNNQTTSFGQVPGKTELDDLVKWLQGEMQDVIFQTERLSVLFPPALAYRGLGSGLLACAISRDFAEFMLFFKPEQLQTVTWAGNPDKAVNAGGGNVLPVSPRKSFEKWVEKVELHSLKWSSAEVSGVLNIRGHIVFQINRKANEIRLLNEKLKHAYQELDTFSYTVSHDLRTPLTALKGYGQLLMEATGDMNTQTRTLVERMNTSVGKMEFMIKEILNYTSLAREEIERKRVNMATLLADIKAEVTAAYPNVNFQFTIADTPDIFGDNLMLSQVFTNLITNAVKYSSKSNPAMVAVNGIINENEVIYTICDNGIGIEEKHFKQVFDLFKRIGNVSDVEGTGVGLAIVKRLVDKHNGRIWLESTLGKGSSFHVAFNNAP